MNRGGHLAFGAGLAAAASAVLLPLSGGVATAGFVGGALAGSVAPDRLEGRVPGLGMRVIPHRTLTHWAVPWTAGLAAAGVWFALSPALPAAVALGVALGGVGHVAADATTPMGVPALHPGRRRRLPVSGGVLMFSVYAAAAGALWSLWNW